MRILSQDGIRFDIGYENCHLVVNEKCCEIEAETSNQNFTPVMASYSSVEKCRKAMDMLRDRYTGKDETVFEIAHIKRSSTDNFYFQFPQDSEIEV